MDSLNSIDLQIEHRQVLVSASSVVIGVNSMSRYFAVARWVR
jgi:hypothetical protein